MKLKNKYAIGCHIMFYEIEMISEYINSCLLMAENVENKENLLFHFTFNRSEYFEKIDSSKISKQNLISKFTDEMIKIKKAGFKVKYNIKTNDYPIYNIPSYRRDLNYNYCLDYDYILWGESDCMWAKSTLEDIENISEYCKQQKIPKHVITFSYRKMWDDSWLPVEHINFKNVKFQRDEKWQATAIESPKSYMDYDTMNRINEESRKEHGLLINILKEPKFDGSCLIISSELIKSGINIPHSLLLCSEDESFSMLCKKILGDNFRQVAIQNVLRVHNRRHPKKRNYILNEENPKGFCNLKGRWWKVLEDMSKENSYKLYHQFKFNTYEDFKKELNK
jgi:hypothetical protein